MASGGNDPFSGSTTRNILQHILSPKIVDGDACASNLVKTDLINVDNVYVSGNLYDTDGRLLTTTLNPIVIGTQTVPISIGTNTIAIGQLAGYAGQGDRAIAIGFTSGQAAQGVNSVAIGSYTASLQQGANSIALGAYAGATGIQAANSIIVNATGSSLENAGTNSLVIKPIRGDTTTNLTNNGFKNLYYNSTTGEICYTTS
jgi:hypothetical protein